MGNSAFDLSFETSPPSDFDGPRREAFFACNGEHMHKIAPTVLLFLASSTLGFGQSAEQDWTNHVRIGAYGLGSDNANAIVEDASRSHVFGIEVDNDIPGRYESYLDPAEKLANIRAVAKKAHEKGNYAFVYIAGTECITANASSTKHTLAKDHPDWLQRKITGESAVFGSDAAFWITKGDEDVWVSPYATEWRKLYMQRVREIAGTGIDGIYVDIPYWMTHFTGWEDTWASFDDYTVAAFKRDTGLDARHDLKLNDFSDPNFRKWVEFRISTITGLLQEIVQNAKSVNPKIKVIPEIYPGIEQEAVRVGADVYSLYPVVDAIAHEYEFGEGDHMASSRSQLDWFNYQVGMHTFRAFAQGKATWILNYSWDGDKNVDAKEAMKNLAMSEIMAGANFWDAPGHSMAGSNDLATRTKIFSWIEANDKTFNSPRKPLHPVGIYFSPATRNFYPSEFLRSYRGVLIFLMQKHLEFQVVTPRTLSAFRGDTLVLPDVHVFSVQENEGIDAFVKSGKRLIVTGDQNATLGRSDANIRRFPSCPGEAYTEALERSFAAANPDSQKTFLEALNPSSSIVIEASPLVATSISQVDGTPHVFFANFAGLQPKEVASQVLQENVRITAERAGEKGYFLPFLGEVQEIRGVRSARGTVFTLPPIAKGAVFWWNEN